MSRKVERFYYKLCIVSLKNYKSKLCVILFDVILLRKQEHSEKLSVLEEHSSQNVSW